MSGQVIPIVLGRTRPSGVTNEQERAAVVKEALSWVGTPFHERAAVKGEKGGVDCARFISAVFRDGIGLATSVPDLSLQINLHRDALREYAKQHGYETEEIYLEELKRAGWREIRFEDLKPGDLVVPKIGHIHWHGSIVIEWPKVISAHGHAGKVLVSNAEVDDWIAGRELKYFSLWGKASRASLQ